MFKKVTLTLVMAAFFSQAANAQLSIKLGLGGQLSGFEITNPDITSSNWQLGSNFNLTAQYGNRFFIESGLILVNSTQTLKPVVDISNPEAVTLSARLTSIHIPA